MGEVLREKPSFMLICDLSLMDPRPYHTTLRHFRNSLIRHGRHATLLEEVNRQLNEQLLKLKNPELAVVDATVVASAVRPSRQTTVMAVDRTENDAFGDEEAQVQMHERLSVDGDARWLKKGSKCHYGYKGFMRCDGEGFVERVMVRPANESEAPHFGAMVEGCTSERVLADKAYSSTANRALLRRAGIMHRAARNRPLTAWQKLFNRLVSRDRYVIEQVFGTLKRRFGCFRARCMGLAKVEGELTFKAAAVNVLKAANMVRLVAA